jgi:hypothetical protein
MYQFTYALNMIGRVCGSDSLDVAFLPDVPPFLGPHDVSTLSYSA